MDKDHSSPSQQHLHPKQHVRRAVLGSVVSLLFHAPRQDDGERRAVLRPGAALGLLPVIAVCAPW